jgi:hypothetical protein
MSPVTRDYIIYAVATIIGFGVYFALHNGYNIDFSISMLVGFVATHGAVILGRRFL